MADKTSTATLGTAQGVVTTAGSTTVGVVTIVFDEAQESGNVIDLVERGKLAIIDYYSDKSS
jgi:hypothetical protein